MKSKNKQFALLVDSFKVDHALEKISTSIQSKLQKTTIGVIYLVSTRPN